MKPYGWRLGAMAITSKAGHPCFERVVLKARARREARERIGEEVAMSWKPPKVALDLTPLVGLFESEASEWCSARDLQLRVVNLNGKPLVCTRDHRLDRVNVFVRDGKVTHAYIG